MAEKTAKEVAEEQVEREESARLESRKAQLEREETARRDQEAKETAAEARRAEAAERAEGLARKRVTLEIQAEEAMAGLKEILSELKTVGSEHRAALQAAGGVQGPGKYQDLPKAISEWSRGALEQRPGLSSRSLAEIDLLNPTSAGSGTRRAPAAGLPGSDPRDAERRENVRFLETLSQRATMLRRQYSRDLSFGELVQPDERDYFDSLSEEQRERVQAMLTGGE